MYEIRLTNCAFFARHGVFDEEQTLGQRFFVDAVLHVEPDAGALEEDRIDGTVDYGAVFSEIERIVTGERRYLVEALALEIARAMCARFAPVRRADITVRKPQAPVAGILDHIEVRVICDG